MNPLVYIASPLSRDAAQNLDFVRQACRYAIAHEITPFSPHLLYPQTLNDNDPAERQLGIDIGNQMLGLCEKLWLYKDRISSGMEREQELAKELGTPVRQISTQEIHSVGFSPTEGMGMG